MRTARSAKLIRDDELYDQVLDTVRNINDAQPSQLRPDHATTSAWSRTNSPAIQAANSV